MIPPVEPAPLPIPAGAAVPAPPVFTQDYDTLVIDMSHLLHRLKHAGGRNDETPYRELQSSEGIYTGGVFGVLKSLKYVLSKKEITFKDVVCVWDGRPRVLSPRRTEMYPAYKNPEPPKVPLTEKEIEENEKACLWYEDQRPRIDEMLRMMGIPVFNIPGREGDDIIAGFVRILSGMTLVMSDDRDYYQLVSPTVHVFRAIKDAVVTLENIEKQAEVKSPFQYLISAAIVGDGSDNITGIEGVGGTTAVRLANAYTEPRFKYQPFMDAITKMSCTDTRNRKRYETVRQNYSIVVRNLMLMDLSLEMLTPTDYSYIIPEYTKTRDFDEMAVGRKFNEYEFKSILQDYGFWVDAFKGRRPAGIKLSPS